MTSSCTAWFRKRRKEVMEKLGNECAKCGNNWDRLDIDHICRIGMGGGRGQYRRARSWTGLGNLQLLCRPCHREKTIWEARNADITEGVRWKEGKWVIVQCQSTA